MAVAPFNWDDAVQWDGPGAIAGSEEILSADRLDRARYAEFLTNYLAAEGKQRVTVHRDGVDSTNSSGNG